MFSKIFERHWSSHPIKSSFFAGIVFTIVSLLLSFLLFKNQPHLIGVTSIFLVVILSSPVFNYIVSKEEVFEKKEKAFFKKNHAVFDYYLYFFLGVLIIFSITSYYHPQYVFSLQSFFNSTTSSISINLPPPSISPVHEFTSILINNLFIIGFSFLLTFLLNSGGIFLLVLNASIAGSLLSTFINQGFFPFFCDITLFSVFFIPEVIGFVLASIAGSLLLLDLLKEKFFSKSFKTVFIDAFLLMVISACFITFGALLEVYVMKDFLYSDLCVSRPLFVIPFFVVMVIIIFLLERKRKRYHKKYAILEE